MCVWAEMGDGVSMHVLTERGGKRWKRQVYNYGSCLCLLFLAKVQILKALCGISFQIFCVTVSQFVQKTLMQDNGYVHLCPVYIHTGSYLEL